MDIISISRKKFKELEKMQLNREIMNTEGTIYLVKDKKKWNSEYKVVKAFEDDIGNSFSNKLFTINELSNNENIKKIEELVLPEKLVASNGRAIGYSMRYVDGINLREIYMDKNYDKTKVINYLYQIGDILRKMNELNKYDLCDGFFLNDIHEDNFVVDKNGIVNVVDMDSAKIGNGKPFLSRYLNPFSPIDEFPRKYKKVKGKNTIGYIDPDYNSDLYCYMVMILNYLYQGNILRLSIKEFYEYLNYLNCINFPYRLLDCFYNLYQDIDNVNPYEYLKLINNNIESASHEVYNYVKCIKR